MPVKRPAPPKIERKKTEIRSSKGTITVDLTQNLIAPPNTPNPLDEVDYTGEIAHDTKAEEGEILRSLKESEKADKDRFTIAVDTEFWCCFVFQSRAQKEAFLTAMDWLKYGDKYLCGLTLANDQGIILPQVDLQTKVRTSKKLSALAEDLGNVKIKRR